MRLQEALENMVSDWEYERDGMGECFEQSKEYKLLKEYCDIEKELGIDLITLFKALKDGFYARSERDLSKIYFYDFVRLGIYHGRFVFYGADPVTMLMITVCVADKDRLALTKEELQ